MIGGDEPSLPSSSWPRCPSVLPQRRSFVRKAPQIRPMSSSSSTSRPRSSTSRPTGTASVPPSSGSRIASPRRRPTSSPATRPCRSSSSPRRRPIIPGVPSSSSSAARGPSRGSPAAWIGRVGVSEGSRSLPHEEDRDRHQLRRGDGPCGAPAGGRGPSDADPVHRWQPRRQGRAHEPGPSHSRAALLDSLAVRVTARRHGARSHEARRSREVSPACGSSAACRHASAGAPSTGHESCSIHPARRGTPWLWRCRTPPARSRSSRHLRSSRSDRRRRAPHPARRAGRRDRPDVDSPVATAATSAPVVDYGARCRAGAGEWVEAKDGVSLETKAIVDGLTNGLTYQCEVAAIGSATDRKWTAASMAVAPMGRPEAPGSHRSKPWTALSGSPWP